MSARTEIIKRMNRNARVGGVANFVTENQPSTYITLGLYKVGTSDKRQHLGDCIIEAAAGKNRTHSVGIFKVPIYSRINVITRR
jgi:hypothetical protein